MSGLGAFALATGVVAILAGVMLVVLAVPALLIAWLILWRMGCV